MLNLQRHPVTTDDSRASPVNQTASSVARRRFPHAPRLLLPGTEDEVEQTAERHHSPVHPEHASPRLDRYLTVTAARQILTGQY